MPISSTRYVEITSGVAGASAIAQRELIGLRFSTSTLTPGGSQLRFANAGLVADHYGSNSPEAIFARQYFGYVSPAPASRPQALLFAAYAPDGRSPMIYGSDEIASLAALQAVTAGTMTIRLGDAAANVNAIDFSAAQSYAEVAAALQGRIRAVAQGQYTNATVDYNAQAGSFVITGGVVEQAPVEVTQGPLAVLLGLTQIGRLLSPGMAAQDAEEAFRAAESISDSFGTASFPRTGANPDLEEAVELSEYVAGLNVKYQLYWAVSPAEALNWSAALISTASTGVILNGTPNEFKEAIPQAVAAAVNYNRRNTVVNFMYRSPTITFTPDVTTDAAANIYDPARVNYYGQTAMYGQNISFFQRGYLCGNPANAPLDMGVHLNEQWLKSRLAADFLNLLIVKGIIPPTTAGRAMGLLLVNDAAADAIFNGTIVAGKELTETQKIEIDSITGDPLAWHEVANNGYWADAEIIRKTGPSGLMEFVLQYTLIYSVNEGVRKVEGSHNLIV